MISNLKRFNKELAESDFVMGFHLGLSGETGYSRNFPKEWLDGYDKGQKARQKAFDVLATQERIMKSKRWWLDKVGNRTWELRYAKEKTVFEIFWCGITAIQVRAMLNRHKINPKN